MDSIVHSVEAKCAELLGVSTKSVEHIQIVRYTKGQHFDLHHDAGTLKKYRYKYTQRIKREVQLKYPPFLCFK